MTKPDWNKRADDYALKPINHLDLPGGFDVSRRSYLAGVTAALEAAAENARKHGGILSYTSLLALKPEERT